MPTNDPNMNPLSTQTSQVASQPASSASSFPTLLVTGVAIILLILLGAGYLWLMPMMGTEMKDAAMMPETAMPSSSSEADQISAELDSFSTAGLDAELSQMESELAQ